MFEGARSRYNFLFTGTVNGPITEGGISVGGGGGVGYRSVSLRYSLAEINYDLQWKQLCSLRSKRFCAV